MFLQVVKNSSILLHTHGPGSSVGTVTGYGLEGPGIESRLGRDFPHLSRPALGPNQPPVQWVPSLSRGVKNGRGVTLTPHPLLVPWSLYLYSPYGPYGLYRASVPVQRWPLPLPYYINNLVPTKCVVKLSAKRTNVNYTMDHSLGISGGVSFFTYFPTTPSFIVLWSFFLDSIFKIALHT